MSATGLNLPRGILFDRASDGQSFWITLQGTSQFGLLGQF